MAVSDWQIWVNYLMTRGSILANVLVPRGPVMGCHVAPSYWQWFVIQNFMESVGVEPRTSPMVQHFGRVWATTSPPTLCSLLTICFKIYLKLIYVTDGATVRARA
jgi:hypothetical protein